MSAGSLPSGTCSHQLRTLSGRRFPCFGNRPPARTLRSTPRQQCRGKGCFATASSNQAPLVKICGITNPQDAVLAASAGADFIGMILWPRAGRAVSIATATEIASAAQQNGAQPVAVFVDEDAETIASVCQQAGIGIAQLHGDGARQSLDDLPQSLQVVYVLHSTPEGNIQTPLPDAVAQHSEPSCRRSIDWLLVDGMKGGSGQALDWHALQPPVQYAKHGWILAGGLTPDNVATAAHIAHPSVVDVSSGVAGPDGKVKDAEKVRTFICAIKVTERTASAVV